VLVGYCGSMLQGKEIQLPDDGLRTETCRSSFSVLMCKFYTSALVGIIIEWLDNMHGVTMKIKNGLINTLFGNLGTLLHCILPSYGNASCYL